MDIEQWTTSVTQSLIAAIIFWLGSKLMSRAKPSIDHIAKVAIPVTKRMWPTALKIGAEILVGWYLITQLRGAIDKEPPLTGGQVALIAFWMWWCLLYFCRLCQFDFIRRDRRQ